MHSLTKVYAASTIYSLENLQKNLKRDYKVIWGIQGACGFEENAWIHETWAWL